MNEHQSQNPGEALRTSRERLGLSINDVSVATKINPRILKALEAGDFSGLPPVSFTRGFIRSYAAYLKIDAQPVLDAFHAVEASQEAKAPTDQENGETLSGQSQTDSSRRDTKSLVESSLTSKIWGVIGVLAVALLIFGVKKVFDKYAQERVIEPSAITDSVPSDSASTSTEPAKATTPESTQPAPAEPPATETAPASTELAGPNPPASSTSTSTHSKSETPLATTSATTTPQPSPTVTAPATPAPTAPPATTVTKTSPQEVILEALDTVEVTVVVDEEPAKKIKLKPEGVHAIKAKGSIQLDIKDGGMVNIIYNGRERGVPGDLGKPVKVKFP